jgi:hypothetical protein
LLNLPDTIHSNLPPVFFTSQPQFIQNNGQGQPVLFIDDLPAYNRELFSKDEYKVENFTFVEELPDYESQIAKIELAKNQVINTNNQNNEVNTNPVVLN